MRKGVKHRNTITISCILLLAAALLWTSIVPGAPLPIPDVDEVYPIVPNWQSARVLHFGDSHVSAAFKSTLADHLRRAGARFKQSCWVGSRSRSWIKSGRLRKLIGSFRPNVVIVTLGTNEMKNRVPERSRSWVRAIIDKIDNNICYWLGPPPLIDDVHGYNDMLKNATEPCRFFDSRTLNIEPRKDGTFHLTQEEGRVWGERVWRWMNGG
jgi:hypothetical protein